MGIEDKARVAISSLLLVTGCSGPVANSEADGEIQLTTQTKNIIEAPILSLKSTRDATYKNNKGYDTDPFGTIESPTYVGPQIIVFGIGQKDNKDYYLITPPGSPKEIWVSADDIWGTDGTSLKDVQEDGPYSSADEIVGLFR